MALAPAAMVSAMLSPVLPPLAMMGMSGNCSRIRRTTWGVSVLQATFRMEAPASSRAWMSVSAFVTVMMTGISTTRETASRFRSEMGELSTTPMAPCPSTSWASCRVRIPLVVPPPTPQKTGM